MSKKRSSRNTKKVLKALKQKRVKYNLGSILRDRAAFAAGERMPSKYRRKAESPSLPPVDKFEPLNYSI